MSVSCRSKIRYVLETLHGLKELIPNLRSIAIAAYVAAVELHRHQKEYGQKKFGLLVPDEFFLFLLGLGSQT